MMPIGLVCVSNQINSHVLIHSETMSKTILDCLPAEDIIFNPHFFLLILLLPIISRISVWSLLILMVREKKGSGWKNLTLTHKIHKHIKVSKERYLLEQDKTSKFWGISITKWHKQQLNCQKQWKLSEKLNHLSVFGQAIVFLSSVWKNLTVQLLSVVL